VIVLVQAIYTLCALGIAIGPALLLAAGCLQYSKRGTPTVRKVIFRAGLVFSAIGVIQWIGIYMLPILRAHRL